MTVLPSGRRLNIRALRRCLKCGISTWHVCYGIRYEKPKPSSDSYEKHLFWSCETCGETSEETKQVPELTEQAMLLMRLLQLTENYEFEASTLLVEGLTITFRARLPAP